MDKLSFFDESSVQKVGNMTRWRTEAGTIDTASNHLRTVRPTDMNTTADMTLTHPHRERQNQ